MAVVIIIYKYMYNMIVFLSGIVAYQATGFLTPWTEGGQGSPLGGIGPSGSRVTGPPPYTPRHSGRLQATLL